MVTVVGWLKIGVLLSTRLAVWGGSWGSVG